jgi:transposase-like protein
MIGLDLGAGNREPITDPMKAKRKRHDAGFKARVALEALKGEKTIQLIAKDFDLHPVQVSEWKKKLLEGASGVFAGGGSVASGVDEASLDKICDPLHAKIGKLTVELDWLRKKSKQLGL